MHQNNWQHTAGLILRALVIVVPLIQKLVRWLVKTFAYPKQPKSSK